MWTRTLTRKAYFCGSPPKILSLHVSPKYQAQVSSSRIKSPLPNFQPHSHYIRNTLLRPSWNKMIIIIIINRLKKIQETNNERIVRLFICDVTNARLTPQLNAPLTVKNSLADASIDGSIPVHTEPPHLGFSLFACSPVLLPCWRTILAYLGFGHAYQHHQRKSISGQPAAGKEIVSAKKVVSEVDPPQRWTNESTVEDVQIGRRSPG